MQISLLHHTPLKIAATAIRTCYQSFARGDDGGEKDRELIERVGCKLGHSSTLEHLVYTFYIDGISRALLQELARHRHASLSVKSTRYTLKELRDEAPFLPSDTERAAKYIRLANHAATDAASLAALERLRALLNEPQITLDVAKYALPECYRTALTYTINARALQNLMQLRTHPRALAEFQLLARALYSALPDEHKYLFTNCLNEPSQDFANKSPKSPHSEDATPKSPAANNADESAAHASEQP